MLPLSLSKFPIKLVEDSEPHNMVYHTKEIQLQHMASKCFAVGGLYATMMQKRRNVYTKKKILESNGYRTAFVHRKSKNTQKKEEVSLMKCNGYNIVQEK